MNTDALVMMLAAEGVVTFFVLYFFIRVLKSPAEPEPDSYSENDDEPR